MGTGPSRHVGTIKNEPRLQWRRSRGTSHQNRAIDTPQDAEEQRLLWTDALAALHTELEELKHQARVEQRGNGAQTKVKDLLHINPQQKQAQSHRTTDSPLIRVDHITDSSNHPTSRRAGSLQIDEPAKVETERSSSLRKYQGGKSTSRDSNKIPLEISTVKIQHAPKNTPKQTTEMISVDDSTTVEQSAITYRTHARITTGTYNCASSSGIAVAPIQNCMGTSGSDETISTYPSPNKEVTKRHKYSRGSLYLLHNISISAATSLPVEGISEGKNKAKSHVPSDLGENTSHRNIDRYRTSTYKKESRNRKIKVLRAACPPEIFCALVCLDGPVPYSQDTEGEDMEEHHEIEN